MPDRFEVQQHEDGQVYITENGRQMHHVRIDGEHRVEVQFGTYPEPEIVLSKLYGPLIFWDIKVALDPMSCEWVIHRSMGPTGEYKEWCRIPGQLEEDFTDG